MSLSRFGLPATPGQSQHILVAVTAFCALSGSSIARAEVCTERSPWVEVTLAGDSWLTEVALDMLLDLRSSMHRAGIAVCVQEDVRRGRPSVEVHLDAGVSDVLIEAKTHGGETEFSRRLALDRLPDDARSRALATSIEEALRSRWDHLLDDDRPLDDDGTPIGEEPETDPASSEDIEHREPPTPEDEPNADRPAPVDASDWSIMVGPTIIGFTEGVVLGGLQAGLQFHPIDFVVIKFLAVGAGVVPSSAEAGNVDGGGGLGAISVGVRFMPREEVVRVGAFVRIDVGALLLRGDAEGQQQSAVGVLGNGWLGAELAIALVKGIDLQLEVVAGTPVAPVYGSTPDGQRMIGAAGFAVAGIAGVAFLF